MNKMLSTGVCTLKQHKCALSCVDYVIQFTHPQTQIHDVIEMAHNVFLMLMKEIEGEYGRLVARVSYTRGENGEPVSYYHPSYSMDVIDDNFFKAHMTKIVERMDNFHKFGSNLLIQRIDEIFVHVAFKQSRKTTKRLKHHGETQSKQSAKGGEKALKKRESAQICTDSR